MPTKEVVEELSFELEQFMNFLKKRRPEFAGGAKGITYTIMFAEEKPEEIF